MTVLARLPVSNDLADACQSKVILSCSFIPFPPRHQGHSWSWSLTFPPPPPHSVLLINKRCEMGSVALAFPRYEIDLTLCWRVLKVLTSVIINKIGHCSNQTMGHSSTLRLPTACRPAASLTYPVYMEPSDFKSVYYFSRYSENNGDKYNGKVLYNRSNGNYCWHLFTADTRDGSTLQETNVSVRVLRGHPCDTR